jgi:hypothetical protein
VGATSAGTEIGVLVLVGDGVAVEVERGATETLLDGVTTFTEAVGAGVVTEGFVEDDGEWIVRTTGLAEFGVLSTDASGVVGEEDFEVDGFTVVVLVADFGLALRMRDFAVV